ncbi:hypothetical protein BLS_000355 [Venturia inaequalis]|uniref:Uncharacterized protein n=1 Tax=Venturia inaequalis TaxID=5025 RepID=A0A8H3U4S7_VENIN|nr:hypothetical protein BLS_000355 [Venturia inaequalis]KAE9963060.1 hypothetical protein EG328_011808 [Venturia inaequalis]
MIHVLLVLATSLVHSNILLWLKLGVASNRAPARLFGRLPLVTRYIWNGFSRTWHNHEYARHRFGPGYLSKPWLLFDVEELEVVEDLINRGDDKKIMLFRRHQLDAFQMVAIVGALVAGAAITMMQLPGMQEVTYVARAFFIVALVMALLAAFFTCIQQRTYGFIEEPAAIRAWLTNGVRYVNCEGKEVYQSSAHSHQLLQAPFELLCISFSTFIAGIGVYLGSAMTQHINLGSEPEKIGNRAVLIAFMSTTAFALGMLGQLLGGTDLENIKCRALTEDFKWQGNEMVLDEVGRKSRESATPRSPEFAVSPPTSLNVPPPTSLTLNVRMKDGEKASGLAKAFEQAAAAHRVSAAADLELARLYEMMR